MCLTAQKEMEKNGKYNDQKIADLEKKIRNSAAIEPSIREQRIDSHHQKVERLLEERENGFTSEQGDTTAYYKEIVNSLGIILEYAACESEVEAEFKKLVNDYKKVIDKNSNDKEVKVMNILQEIRDTDFSAFYREELLFDSVTNVREFVQKEYLPDLVLMPNVGTRGVMWQEIEGKIRSSHATYVLPIFLLEDMEKTIIRMTGEYRFEMCKRTQGARWNDVSDPSLTSEYCDYIQFYRKNNELSASNKEQIKTALMKARNSYKQMFAGDYLTWILYEGKGSPRLNKVARRILFAYCPFKKEMRDSLLDNPLYRDIIARYDIKNGQAVTRFHNLLKKLEGTGKEVPKELYRQQEFLEM